MKSADAQLRRLEFAFALAPTGMALKRITVGRALLVRLAPISALPRSIGSLAPRGAADVVRVGASGDRRRPQQFGAEGARSGTAPCRREASVMTVARVGPVRNPDQASDWKRPAGRL